MTKKCPHCSEEVEEAGFKVHVRACFFVKKGESLIFKESDLDESVRLKEVKAEIEYRMKLFRQDRRLEGSVFAQEDLTGLTAVQFRSIEAVRLIAQDLSDLARPAVLKRLIKLGFDRSVLNSVESYIRDNAPLIIHLSLRNVLSFLLKDDHYRNCLEVRGHDAQRVKVESQLLHYPPETKPLHRVKYGVQNILRDSRGVLSCYGYGPSYLKLRNVRMRTTFADQDTYGADVQIATCEHYVHVLDKYNDEELRAVAKASLGKSVCQDSTRMGHYKEVQYHGDVNLYRDVECLIANDSERNGLIGDQLKLFTQKFGVPCYWMSEYAKLGVLEMEGQLKVIDQMLGR